MSVAEVATATLPMEASNKATWPKASSPEFDDSDSSEFLDAEDGAGSAEDGAASPDDDAAMEALAKSFTASGIRSLSATAMSGGSARSIGDSVDDQAVGREKELEGMRAAVHQAGYSLEDISDHTLTRFLIARAFKVDKAAAMYVEHRKWRREYFPPGAERIPFEQVARPLHNDMICLQAAPGEMTWVVCRSRFHDVYTRKMDEFIRMVVYTMEKAVASLPPGHSRFGVIMDLEGVGYRNLDSRGGIAALTLLQSQFPERLSQLFFVHVPSIFWGVWKIICPFIDPNTKRKLRFVEDRHLHKTLSAAVSPTVLPTIYGGERELVHIRDVEVSNWPANTD